MVSQWYGRWSMTNRSCGVDLDAETGSGWLALLVIMIIWRGRTTSVDYIQVGITVGFCYTAQCHTLIAVHNILRVCVFRLFYFSPFARLALSLLNVSFIRSFT